MHTRDRQLSHQPTRQRQVLTASARGWAYTVSIKWGKQELNDLEIDTTQPPMVFKTQIFSMTGVPVERQKIMVKGGMLKDDADWTKLGIKPGQKLMMMGTADAVPVAPTKAIEFVEGTPLCRSLSS